MGRYFLYRIFPLSVAEIVNTHDKKEPISPPTFVNKELVDNLMEFGGFPENFIKAREKISYKMAKCTFYAAY